MRLELQVAMTKAEAYQVAEKATRLIVAAAADGPVIKYLLLKILLCSFVDQ